MQRREMCNELKIFRIKLKFSVIQFFFFFANKIAENLRDDKVSQMMSFFPESTTILIVFVIFLK